MDFACDVHLNLYYIYMNSTLVSPDPDLMPDIEAPVVSVPYWAW